MDYSRIRKLLDKYYEGETNLEEENQLKDFFSYENIPDEFLPDKKQFNFFSLEANVKSNKKYIHPIVYLSEKSKNRKVLRTKYIIGMAASVLIFFSIYFTYKTYKQHRQTVTVLEDTYSDPKKAYEEAKKTLFLVSEKINTGKEQLNKLSKFQEIEKKILRSRSRIDINYN